MKFVVMAGGLGTKLWPMSRDTKPKQFQPMVGNKTLIQQNIDSLLLKYQATDIFVSTNEQYIDYVKQQIPQIPYENYIIEPALKKDTGPASGYAMLKVAQKFPDEVVMFYVQPICVREPAEKYIEMIDGMEDLVKRESKLISGGNRPRYVGQGSDYLELGNQVQSIHNLEVYEVNRFIDKMNDYQKTKELIENFHVATHCNHLTSYPHTLFEAIKEYKPDWYKVLMEIKEVLGKPDEQEQVNKIYAKFEPGRIELVTKQLFNNNKGLIVLLPFTWTHIATWDDIYQYTVGKGEIYADGQVVAIDSKNSLIKGDKKKVIATIGIDNLVIVDTEDALLVCSKDRTSDIKQILDELKAKGLNEYL